MPQYYYLMNFNSFSSGMVTLFHFMVVNNWSYTTEMYATVMDINWLPVFFFGTFWVAVVLILLNVVLSMVLEIYTSVVEPEVQRQAEKLELIKQLK